MKTRNKGRPISIRLYPEDEELLREEAPAGTKSLGVVAERILVQRLRHNGDEELGALRQKVIEIEGDLQRMRQELRDSVKAILYAVTDRDKVTRDHVNEWIESRFKKE